MIDLILNIIYWISYVPAMAMGWIIFASIYISLISMLVGGIVFIIMVSYDWLHEKITGKVKI